MHADQEFYGTTTIGERGQIVIPQEARKAMKLKNADKLLAFGMGNDMLVLAKVSQLQKFAKNLSTKLSTLQVAIDSAKPAKKKGKK
ncbi:MAG TPA: AbrB/MazE/SpoVT family DNA-binding domain-containing protein [Patescibacteria group bacterium]|jgi:AbrB family looped-hinge helix DNA binding protein|nr:AbrB/MazE/SpoVT family DNA-binding domain-containing protein [Patescibacteria group bacterium]